MQKERVAFDAFKDHSLFVIWKKFGKADHLPFFLHVENLLVAMLTDRRKYELSGGEEFKSLGS